MAFSDQSQTSQSLRRLFLPDAVNLISESLIGISVLVIAAINDISRAISGSDVNANPLTYINNSVSGLLSKFDVYSFMPTLATFILWMIVGFGTYVIVYELIKGFTNIFDAVEADAEYVHPRRYQSANYWSQIVRQFAGWFIVACFAIVFAVFAFGVVLAYASALFTIIILSPSEEMIFQIPLILLSAALGTRLFVISVCLLIPGFRRWYCA
jgi:hypothetical protein